MKRRKSPAENPWVAVDTGGTFTDFYLLTQEGFRIHKVLSTPQDPSRAIRKGLKELGLKKNFQIVHGSTVATNAFLERKGARVALITTAGFEDLLEIGRQNRPALYELCAKRNEPLVPSKRRYGVLERIGVDGKVLIPLTAAHVAKLVKRLGKGSVDAVAVCLLSSYANPRHEEFLRRRLQPLGKFLSLSSEVCPEYREYERTSTVCINAYVTPVMAHYLDRLQNKVRRKIRVMQSNGGSLSIREASRAAIRTLLSGPAGGALGAFDKARRAGRTKVLSLDMGGTSTDMSLMDGEIELTSEGNLGGMPVKTPMIRIDTIGAGGGSIAWIDEGGALRVGPQSAGARPGPVCYGMGGERITVTDAHVFLGRIPPKNFLGGAMKLHEKKIHGPLAALAKKLKLSREETADGILAVANANMARALRVLSLERGYDPRNFTLVPFGGAGALHACELAAMLGIPQVLVPSHPGILSAYGMAHADWVRDYVTTVLLPEAPATPLRLKKTIDKLKAKAWAEARREGFSRDRVQFKALCDIRYRGQSFEISVPYGNRLKDSFEKAHLRQFSFLHEGHAMEIVNIRLQASVVFSKAMKRESKSQLRHRVLRGADRLRLYWNKKHLEAHIFERDRLFPGGEIRGPAVIAEYSATTFVPPGWEARCDNFLNLRMVQGS